MSDYDFKINGVPFYASQQPSFAPYGLDSFDSNGRPTPFGPGSFVITLNALAVNDPTSYGAPFGTSGTFQQLFTIWRDSIGSAGGLQEYNVYDPRSDSYISVQGRLNITKLLQSFQGGANLPNVTIQVDSAFFPGVSPTGYYGGDPDPVLADVPYIPGDTLPDPDPDLSYGWGVGGWGNGLWGRGEGV